MVPYYNAHGLKALVPAAIDAGVTQADNIAAFLDHHDLEDTARRVRRVMELPENEGKSFKGLFARSVYVMLKQFSDK